MANLDKVKANPIKITLIDGVEREMLFTLNAMAELEDKYGTVEKAFEALEANSFKAIRCVLWAGLLYSDESITERQVGALIDMSKITELVASMTSAFESSMPDTPNGQPAGASPNVVKPVLVQ